MNILGQAALITLVAFIGYMHCYWGSTMNNRPIIMAALTGLVLNDFKTGIMIGATLELIFLGAVPIGASNPPDFTSGAILSSAFVIITKHEPSTAVALAVPIATLVSIIDNVLMMFVLTYASHICDKYALKGDAQKVELIARVFGIGNKVVLALIVGLGFYLGIPIVEKVLSFFPAFILHGIDVVAGILPAIGFAMLARMIITKELSPYLLLGFLLAAYLNVSVLGVALFGVAIVLINYFNNPIEIKEENDNEF